MKLILELKDVDTSHFMGYYPHIDSVNLEHFPENIRSAARYASVVEYHDGKISKILKDRNACTSNYINQKIKDILDAKYFIAYCITTGRNGVIDKVVLERQ